MNTMDTKDKRSELIKALKDYFNGDVTKVKRFGNQLKSLGFDLNDMQTLEQLDKHGEALIVLLGLSNFGVLQTVSECILYIRGHSSADDFIKEYGERIMKMPPPK